VSIAVFSGILVSTIDRGVDAAAQAAVGADLQASGPVFGDALMTEIEAISGVSGLAGVDDAGPGVLRVDGVRSTITMLVVDFAALSEMRDVPAGLEGGSPVPVIVSSDLAADLPADAKLQVEGVAVEAVASTAQEEGLSAGSRWIMVDKAFASELTGVDFRPRLVLVDLEPTADAAAITTAILEVAGPATEVLNPEEAAAEIRSAPTAGGLAIALVIAMIIAGILSAVAVVMTSVVGSRARTRLLALLATLGLTARQARGLAAWEIAPIALTAIVAGTLLGLAMPWIILGGVDLTPFTGGSSQPAVAIDPLIIGALVLGFITVVVLAVLVAVAIGRRVSAAVTLRMGEE
jgi:putative ABC transport system permease protein